MQSVSVGVHHAVSLCGLGGLHLLSPFFAVRQEGVDGFAGEGHLQNGQVNWRPGFRNGLDGIVVGGLSAACRPQELLRIEFPVKCCLDLLQDHELLLELVLMMKLGTASELSRLLQEFIVLCKLAVFLVGWTLSQCSSIFGILEHAVAFEDPVKEPLFHLFFLFFCVQHLLTVVRLSPFSFAPSLVLPCIAFQHVFA